MCDKLRNVLSTALALFLTVGAVAQPPGQAGLLEKIGGPVATVISVVFLVIGAFLVFTKWGRDVIVNAVTHGLVDDDKSADKLIKELLKQLEKKEYREKLQQIVGPGEDTMERFLAIEKLVRNTFEATLKFASDMRSDDRKEHK